MNREEAIEFANEWIKTIDSSCDNDKRNLDDEDEELYEFLKAAVSALQQQTDDAISKQTMLDAIAAYFIWENEYNLTSSRIKNAVEKMPSVSTEKTGRWIDTDEGFSPCECSECEKVGFIRSKYCPNCGAKMEEEE